MLVGILSSSRLHAASLHVWYVQDSQELAWIGWSYCRENQLRSKGREKHGARSVEVRTKRTVRGWYRHSVATF